MMDHLSGFPRTNLVEKQEKNQLFDSSNHLTSLIKTKMIEIKQIKEQAIHPIEKYKSWQFGMYDENHQWQEVSWVWFIMASVTGLNDYLDSYKRNYTAEAPIGGISYINSML